jgi:hypothetical protein
MIYIGVDNGVTGSIGIIRVDGDEVEKQFHRVPIKTERHYRKKGGRITRVDINTLVRILWWLHPIQFEEEHLIAIERPMVNPGRFQASLSAVRALEAVQIVLDQYAKNYTFIDSKQWQKALLHPDARGEELKSASKLIGLDIAPEYADIIKKHGDADGLLIAEYLYRYDGIIDFKV